MNDAQKRSLEYQLRDLNEESTDAKDLVTNAMQHLDRDTLSHVVPLIIERLLADAQAAASIVEDAQDAATAAEEERDEANCRADEADARNTELEAELEDTMLQLFRLEGPP